MSQFSSLRGLSWTSPRSRLPAEIVRFLTTAGAGRAIGKALEIHVAHATATRHRRCRPLLRPLGDHRFCRYEKSGHRSSALQRQAYDLGRVDNAVFHHVDINALLRVISVID